MKAGRELDKLIAEKVFEYTVRVSRNITHQVYEYAHKNINYPDRNVWLSLPHYSTSNESSLKVVEKLGEFQLTFSEGKWAVDQLYPVDRITNKNLPEAICNAALDRMKYLESQK
jgi:hypothetical protein